MVDNSDPNTGPNPWTIFFGGGDPSAPPTAQGYGPPNTGDGSFPSTGGGGGGGGGGGTGSGGLLSGGSAAPTPQSYTGEDDIMVGLDGQIFQRIRDGFRTVGWKPLGSTADLAGAAAAGGVKGQLMVEEVQRQQNTNNAQSWQAGQSGYNGLSNLQLQQQNETSTGIVNAGRNAWSLGQSGYNGMTNLQLQQQNDTNTGILGAGKNAWDLGQSSYDAGQTRQGASLRLGEQKDQYASGETAYGLQHQQEQHGLEDQQRRLAIQQAGFNLGREAQRQQTEKVKLNDTSYQQSQGMANRDLTGYGYGAMSVPQHLVGQ